MKVLFIVLPYVVKDINAKRSKVRSYLAFPYGLLSIATYCKDRAEIRIIDCDTEDHFMTKTLVTLKEFAPDIVGFSMMFDNSYVYLRPLLHMVHSYNPQILTVLGGAAASYSYEEILNEQFLLDAVCYSEGERAFRGLLNSKIKRQYLEFDPSWITLQGIMNGKKPRFNFVHDLDLLIDIDYSFVDPEKYEMKEAFSPHIQHDGKHRQFFISTTRGCPFDCVFCSNAVIHGKTMRYASVGAIINHIEKLVYEYDMNVLTIYDDQLLIDKERAKELFRRLKPFGLRIECPNGLSVAYMDHELIWRMREAGMDTAYLAIESGSPYVLKEIIRKPLNLNMVAPVVESLRYYGFFIHGFFVLGCPGETDEHRKETVDFIKSVGLDWAGMNPATPVRGSRLYDMCIENGWIKKQTIYEIEDKKYIINIPGIPAEEIEQKIYRMNLDVNFVNNFRMKIGDYQTAINCFAEVLCRYKDHAFAHYYMAKCYGELKKTEPGLNDICEREYYREYEKIIGEDEYWRNLAEEFGL